MQVDQELLRGFFRLLVLRLYCYLPECIHAQQVLEVFDPQHFLVVDQFLILCSIYQFEVFDPALHEADTDLGGADLLWVAEDVDEEKLLLLLGEEIDFYRL